MTTHAPVRWTQRPKTPCRSTADIRLRLSAGARTIIIDTDRVLELDDSHFAGTTHTWTMRIAGVSPVRINLAKKLPQRITIAATDASTVQATGVTELHAYTNATVDAFDDCKVTGHNNATISACDRVVVGASENTTVNAYDASTVHAARPRDGQCNRQHKSCAPRQRQRRRATWGHCPRAQPEEHHNSLVSRIAIQLSTT